MNRTTSIFAALALAASSSLVFAGSAKKTTNSKPLPPLPTYPNQLPLPTSPVSQNAARTQAAAASNGVITAAQLAEAAPDWSSKYTLYVNCPTAPSDVNFTDIQSAVNMALISTTIKVCPGTYEGGIVVPTSFVKIVGVGTHSGNEVIAGPTGPNPSDNSFGVLFTANNDVVENMTFTNLEFAVGTGLIFQTGYGQVKSSWFNEDTVGVFSLAGFKTGVKENHFVNNNYPVVSAAGVKEMIKGNIIEGDFLGDDDGILVLDSISTDIETNTVTGVQNGLDYQFFNSFSWVEGNHFNENVVGVSIANNNSGNYFQSNIANDNLEVGFAADATSGVQSQVNSGPNKFLKDQASGNGSYDFIDGTFPYAGGNPATNSKTANYYWGAKGKVASPASIF